MPPFLALFLCTAFILYLLRLDKKRELNFSGALWIPIIWMVISGSRFISEWIYGSGIQGNILEGSPLDAAAFFILIISGSIILSRRDIHWIDLIKKNACLMIFIGYSGISILWSDFPFVAFKRWFKEIGNFIMVIVILSENDFNQTIKSVLKRVGYFLIPFSIVLIKYFPEYGRGYSEWTGEVQYRGVGANKNYLGLICLVCGFFYLWIISATRDKGSEIKRNLKENLIYIFFLLMVFWLFEKANSATSTLCFIFGTLAVLGLQIKFIKARLAHIGYFSVIILITLLTLQLSLGISDIVISAFGRESTLTDRIPLWEEIISLGSNPIVGCGYQSFWLWDKVEIIWEKRWWRPNSTHNGYLDIYVNLGWIGIILFMTLIIYTIKKVKDRLLSNFEHGRYLAGWLIVLLLYNFTETAFSGINLIWFIFILVAFDYQKQLK
jgi:ABC-type multidrug transport system fused ATPase/permease subunit